MSTAFSPHSKPSLMNGSRTRYWSAWLLKKAQMWRCSRRTVPPIRIGPSVPRESRGLCEAGCKSSLLMAIWVNPTLTQINWQGNSTRKLARETDHSTKLEVVVLLN